MTQMRFSLTAITRALSPLVVAAAAGLVLVACSGSSAAGGSSQASNQPGATSNDTAGGGEAAAGSGEAPAVRYQNPRFHYRVDAPGAMKEAADGSASASAGVERLAISVITGSSAADLRAYADSDLQQVQASSPKYHLMQPLSSITISGHSSLKAVYSWTDGTNQVTGKPDDLVTVRYYIPKDGSMAAVLTYSVAANQYDPQGADDVASTFTWQ